MTLAPEQNPNNLPPEPETPVDELFAQATFAETPGSEPDAPNKRKRAGVTTAIIAASTLLVGGGTAAGLAIAHNTAPEQTQDNPDSIDDAPDDDPIVAQPSPSDLPDPEPTSIPIEVEVPSESKEPVPISAELTDPNEIAEAYIENLTNWANYGEERALEILDAKAFGSEAQFNAKIEGIVQEAGQKYMSVLFVDRWQEIPSLVEFYEHRLEDHRATLALKAYTTPESGTYPQYDLEVYKVNATVESTEVISTSETLHILRITTHDYDNNEKNRVGEDLTQGKILDTTSTFQAWFEKTDSGLKLATVIN